MNEFEKYNYKELVISMINELPNDKFMKQIYTIIRIHCSKVKK